MARVLNKIQNVSGKAQADGAQTISLADYEDYLHHSISFEPSASPVLAGTLAVAVKIPGADSFYAIGTMDLTDATDYVMQYEGAIESIQITPSSFDAAKTYSLYVSSTK